MVGFVYVLETKNGRYYVGSTNDLNRRIKQHEDGKSLATKNVRPIKLLFYKKYETILEAIRMEKYIKKQKDTLFIKKFMDS